MPHSLVGLLSRYIWNLYEIYQDGRGWDDARIRLDGAYRGDNPSRSRGGYVAEKEGEEVFLNLTRTIRKVGQHTYRVFVCGHVPTEVPGPLYRPRSDA